MARVRRPNARATGEPVRTLPTGVASTAAFSCSRKRARASHRRESSLVETPLFNRGPSRRKSAAEEPRPGPEPGRRLADNCPVDE